MALVYLSDIRLNAVIEGPVAAPAVVLMHALGTDLTIWDGVAAALAPRFRVLRLDLRGHGASDVPPAPYGMGALVRDVERVMEHFGLTEAVVAGVSLGGLVAQGLAVKRLDLVRGLVLSNTAARIGGPTLWQARVDQVRQTGLADYAPGAMERLLGRGWREHPQMPRLRALLLGTDPEGWIGCAQAIAGADFYTTTAGLTLPALVIAGTRDGTTPPDLVRETAELMRGAEFVLMRGVGHLPMVEAPEAFAGLVEGFLQRIGHG